MHGACVLPEAAPVDLALCRSVLSRGSRSFTVASWLLPRRVRDPAAAFYAFCRVADDLVDEGDPSRGLDQLRARVDDVFGGRRLDDPIDRALAMVMADARVPRAVIDALVEGFAWDAGGRRYANLDELHDYGVRVASTVGVVMALVMGCRDAAALARACDLGAAMQLTNIARDVGEDARRGRIYLPLDRLEAAGVDPDAWLARPTAAQGVRVTTLELLDEADRLYQRASAGIGALPSDCRVAIRAASAIYRDIGRVIRRHGGDGVTRRARVGATRKLWLVLRSFATSDEAHGLAAPAIPAAQWLVEAVA
jgi:phytoene synthase